MSHSSRTTSCGSSAGSVASSVFCAARSDESAVSQAETGKREDENKR